MIFCLQTHNYPDTSVACRSGHKERHNPSEIVSETINTLHIMFSLSLSLLCVRVWTGKQLKEQQSFKAALLSRQCISMRRVKRAIVGLNYAGVLAPPCLLPANCFSLPLARSVWLKLTIETKKSTFDCLDGLADVDGFAAAAHAKQNEQ